MQTTLYTHDDAMRSDAYAGSLSAVANWISAYPMREHPDQGRIGIVCPFVKQAARLETLRIGVSQARAGDEDQVFAEIRSSFAELERIPAPRGKANLRTIIVGFPSCTDADGVAMLERVYKRHKYYTLLRSRMIAFFHPEAKMHGLWNPDFLSMLAPLPVLAVRYLVEQDSVFAAKHRLMTLPYLLRFGPLGARRLLAHRQRTADFDA